jgi:TonB family protein
VSSTLGPRGVQRIGGGREVAVAVDDEDGWRPHRLGESGGTYAGAALSEALGAADAAARACVERKRALRPSLAGTVTVSALVDAEGHVTEAAVASSSLGDGETDACIARAVRGLSLPPPALLGAVPGRVTRSFEFGAATGSGAAARNCPPTSRLPRSLRRVLWRERLAARGVGWSAALSVWTDAASRCELRWWEDRVALLELLVDELGDPAQVVEFRNAVTDSGAVDWLDAAIARRFGASWVWRAHQSRRVMIDWDSLLTRLAAPGITPAQKVTLLRAWLAVAPRDIDLRLRLMAALEEAALPREARSLGDRLRRDPIADARVRGQVAEFLLRVGDRTEALRAFTEIAEFAPYDPYARARLGDLLLTYGWAPEAYHHYQTLTLLQPGDSLALVRVALAALASGREDEGLRLLRRSAEESGGDASGIVARRLLDAEVARVAAARPDDPAVRAWLRAATPVGSSRDTELTVRWTHPDVGVEILSRPAAETAFTAVGESPAAIGVRAWTPAGPLDGTRLVVRAPVGMQGGRVAEARVQLLTPGETGVRLLERVVRFDREHRAFGFVAQGGSLVEEPVAPTEVPARVEALE